MRRPMAHGCHARLVPTIGCRAIRNGPLRLGLFFATTPCQMPMLVIQPKDGWSKYESKASRNVSESDQASPPISSFAVNENGLFNVAGDVWEWTNTCFVRRALDGKAGSIGEPIVNCGVRVVEGR